MRRQIDMALSLCLLVLATAWGWTAPQEEVAVAKGKAQALLLLCRAQDHVIPQGNAACLTDPAKAQALAQLENRQLFYWVGGCDPELRECFPGGVHCHLDDWQGDATHTLLVPGEPGFVYAWAHPTAAVAPSVRSTLQRLKTQSAATCSGGSCRPARR